MNQRRSRGRDPLDLSNPIDLIVELIVWRLRGYGRQLVTGVVLVAGILLLAAGLFIPLALASLLITVLGLAVEPYKWIGTILIVVAFVVGIVAAPLILLHVVRRGGRVIAMTELGDADDGDPSGLGPSPIVAPEETRELWNARIRAMDEHMASPPDPPRSGS